MRFRAYTSDSDDSEEDVSMEVAPPKRPARGPTRQDHEDAAMNDATRAHGDASDGTSDEDEEEEESEEEEEWQREAAAQLAAEAEEEKRRQEEEKVLQEEEARKLKEAEKQKGSTQLNMPERVDLSIDEAKALFKVRKPYMGVWLWSDRISVDLAAREGH